MHKILALAALLTSTSAFAADMPYRQAKAVPFTWTGGYIGAGGGYGTSKTDGIDFKGATAGGNIGFNYQWNMLVAGGEFSLNWADIGQKVNFLNIASAESVISSFGTAHFKLGFAIDRLLVYGLGGFAFANNGIKMTVLGQSVSSSKNHTGYVVGGGAEYAISDNWTIRGEYQYASYGSANYFTDLTPGGIASGKVNVQTAKIGFNYLLNN